MPRVVLLLAALAVALPAQRAPVIDNNDVRVLLVTDSPGRKTALHEHAMNRVMIYLDSGRQTLRYADGRVEDIKFPPGEARWSPAGGKHTSENTGGKPFRVVEVELKGPGRPVTFGALDPVRLAPDMYKVVIDNPQVRVLHVRVGPNRSVPFHEHGLNRVVVFMTDANLKVTDEGGNATALTAKAGEVRWGGTAKHAEENLATGEFEVVVVELK
jgi:uncharacterized RmlC-like cupin family protein